MKRTAVMVLALFASAAPTAAAAQDASPERLAAGTTVPGDAAVQDSRRVWGGMGISLGTVGIGLGLDLSMLSGRSLYSGRLTFQGSIDAGGTNNPESLMVSELGVMYGRGTRFAGGNWGSVSAGIALVSGDRDDEAFETVGVPVQAQLVSRRMPHLGATLAANLNTEVPFAAFILSLQIGRVP